MKVSKGRIKKPFRALWYGPGGVGKTTLASYAPKPVFLDPTNGTAQLDLVRYEEEEWSWPSLDAALAAFEKDPYETLVIDELGAFEQLAWREICKSGNKNSIGDFPYGRGYQASLDLFKALTVKLDRIGKNVILIGHSTIKQFNNPEGSDYHRYILSLHEKVAGLLYQWVDAYLLCRYEDWTAETEDKNKKIGMSSGERKIYTVHRAAYDCKNRYNLPEEMSMDEPELLYQLIIDGHDPGKLIATIHRHAVKLSDEDAKKLASYMGKAKKDSSKLVKVLNWVKARKAKAA
jgi:hypothetical protein